MMILTKTTENHIQELVAISKSAFDEFQVQIYSFQTQKNVQYYFVDDTTQTYVRVDYDKENAVLH